MKTNSVPKPRIAKQYEYKAKNNQDRLVLGYTKDRRVVYAERGGGVKYPYKVRRTCARALFRKDIYWRSAEKVSLKMFNIVKAATHADSVIGK